MLIEIPFQLIYNQFYKLPHFQFSFEVCGYFVSANYDHHDYGTRGSKTWHHINIHLNEGASDRRFWFSVFREWVIAAYSENSDYYDDENWYRLERLDPNNPETYIPF